MMEPTLAIHNRKAIGAFTATQLEKLWLSNKRFTHTLLETILLEEGKYFLLPEHLSRLENSYNSLFESDLKFLAEVEEAFYKMAHYLPIGKYRMRVLVNDKSWMLAAYFFHRLPQHYYLSVVTSFIPQGPHKLLKRTAYQEALNTAKAEQNHDALLVDGQGRVIESCIANLFWVKSDQIFTPSLSNGCIPGVYQQYLQAQLKGTKWAISEKNAEVSALLEADEIWLGNSLQKLWPVCIKGQSWHGFEIGMAVQALDFPL